jgi:SNF2-related protein
LAANELRRKIFPFVLRRLKREVLNDLPDLITQSIDVDMEPAQATFYERRRADYYERIHKQIATEGLAKSQFMMLQALTELRRIASVPESLSDGEVRSAKMPLLIDKLSDLAANGHKTVVFFNFVAGIEIAGEELERLGIEYETMTGSTTKRKNVIDRFQNNPECKVLLMTLKTGGVGLNLTAADTVIIYEPWWNAAAEQQGINRLHRIGQKKKVMSISLFTKGTIEEKIRELQERKSLLVDDIISSDTGMSKQLTEEDIDFILG